jgi:hypothetical protein
MMIVDNDIFYSPDKFVTLFTKLRSVHTLSCKLSTFCCKRYRDVWRHLIERL